MLDNGIFTDGPQPMLWRPELDHARLRRQGVVESVVTEPLPFACIGTAVGVLAGGWIGLMIDLLCIGLAVLWSISSYRCWGLDCSRPGWTRHRRDRGGGDWFYRRSDFERLPAASRDQVDTVFQALTAFDETAVLSWLDNAVRVEVHQVAWTLLDCLHDTIPARTVLARASADLAGDAVVALVRYELVRRDAAIAVGVQALRETSALVRELAERVTAPGRRAALRADLRCLRLPEVPSTATELREDVRNRVRAVHDVLDLAGTAP
ncbi:hypothetical protein [Kutzneria buriramensis]|uniref:Uncharacterized protein n=1 Tax=Kutzneria buriramensis TaxID=1045776 RepID=A0A3E0GUR8_9PSEU|nr:hypothetical protein [Kutzneria buriramensis]REH28641.1 hypothetical protein BCF44_12683 [Kutzneria buriramensis]